MNMLDWFKSIAFALNDSEPAHEFARYPVGQMVNAYNAGLCLVSKYRPDLFTEYTVVKLKGGKYQDTRGCCVNVFDVTDQTDKDGNIIKELSGTRDTKTKVKTIWNKPSCITYEGATDGYVIDNVDIDPNMNGRFTVEPPVPCDVDAYARVKCVTRPCSLGESEVNSTPAIACDMLSALWYFVLARMQAGDRFTEVPYTNMQYNHKMFFEILGVVMQQEDHFESPEEA